MEEDGLKADKIWNLLDEIHHTMPLSLFNLVLLFLIFLIFLLILFEMIIW